VSSSTLSIHFDLDRPRPRLRPSGFVCNIFFR
jgi:hypothetical protein